MNIRSVTAFMDISLPLDSEVIADQGETIRAVKGALQSAGYEVQTTRLATQPLALGLGEAGPDKAVELAKDLEAIAFVHEIDFVALGPIRLADPPAYLLSIPTIFEQTNNIVASIEIASREGRLKLSRMRRTGEIIKRVAEITRDGFANFRLGALANVPAWVPFFPSGYHGGGTARIGIATESADLAVQAVGGTASMHEAREQLVRSIEVEAAKIENVVRSALGDRDTIFQGIDFSFAPFPDKLRSIGTAIERLGVPVVGGYGTMMAAAFLMDALDRARFTRSGFCGLFLPVLEDAILAGAASEGVLQVGDLLAYSAVCGTGLDTIPLPGTVAVGEIAAILLDVAALALRLDKPLAARLLPIPGMDAGDICEFEFDYFSGTRVMATKGNVVEGLLAGDEEIEIGAFRRLDRP